jgi:spermidine/putrescine transport system ATP-binding protein
MTKRGSKILNEVSLKLPSSKFVALLGPSGCGKTTLLRAIAGFEKIDSGRIFLGEKDISHLPVHQRSMNYVFQDYALFPHLTVEQNIAYSLTIQRRPRMEIDQRVKKLLKSFDIESLLHRYPEELSGGQQQRVAIARAIISEPHVLLLDEPLAALDFKLSERMLIELIDLQDLLQMTFLYVTHDQLEALTVADLVIVMGAGGTIEQIGTPKEVYEFPKNAFVANFVGSTNLFEGQIQEVYDKEVILQTNSLELINISISEKAPWIAKNNKAVASIRPEKIDISKKPLANFSNNFKGIVTSIVYEGMSTKYYVQLQTGRKIIVFEQNEHHFIRDEIGYDDVVYVSWQKENVVLMER